MLILFQAVFWKEMWWSLDLPWGVCLFLWSPRELSPTVQRHESQVFWQLQTSHHMVHSVWLKLVKDKTPVQGAKVSTLHYCYSTVINSHKNIQGHNHGALMRSCASQPGRFPPCSPFGSVWSHHNEHVHTTVRSSMNWQSNSLKIYCAFACLKLICNLWRTNPHSWASYVPQWRSLGSINER